MSAFLGMVWVLPLQAGEMEARAILRFTFTQQAGAGRGGNRVFGGYVNEGLLIVEYIEVAIQVHSIANVIFFAGDTQQGQSDEPL